jgi:DNA-binding transcriptional regulator YhcF (GntR family)
MYEQIVADIRRRIEAGELRAGDRVPSARQITREWGVAIATATKALAALRQQDLVRAVPGVGTVVQEPRRVTRELSRGPIVRAAIAIADAEGLGGVSMRRLATDLGVATMALYRHVRGKEDLVVLMADATFARMPPPATPPPGWRAQLEAIARLHWAGYARHPWLPTVISMTRPQVMPHGMAHTEWTLRALGDLGLPPNERMHAGLTLIGYVRGMAMSLESEARARQDTGLTDQEWMGTQDAAFAAVFAAGSYPVLVGLTAAGDVDLDLDSLFEFGLRTLLDGFAVRAARTMGR